MIDMIAKLNAAGEPDRELDLEIHLAIEPDGDIAKLMKFPRGLNVGEGMHWDIWQGGSVVFEKREVDGSCNYNGGYPLPSYTGSIDAAMTLLPEGVNILDLKLSWDTTTTPGYPACSVRWFEPGDGVKDWKACTVSAKTVSITVALAAMTLRSRASLTSGDRDA